MLSIKGLNKRYSNFDVGDVSFDIPDGSVVGLIGENGAGKSTVIKCILGAVHPDGGQILLNGKRIEGLSRADRQKIAFVLDDIGLPMELNLTMLNNVLSNIFEKWDGQKFRNLTRKFNLPDKKPLKQFSKGMKMKAAIAVALSYDSQLLILDEPTSGLDPVVRDEILQMIYDYNQNDNRAALISSHITTDLEKICDYIAFLHKGRLLLCEEKDRIMEEYGILHCTAAQLAELDPSAVKGKKESAYGVEAIVERNKVPATLQLSPVDIEQLFIFMVKEAH